MGRWCGRDSTCPCSGHRHNHSDRRMGTRCRTVPPPDHARPVRAKLPSRADGQTPRSPPPNDTTGRVCTVRPCATLRRPCLEERDKQRRPTSPSDAQYCVRGMRQGRGGVFVDNVQHLLTLALLQLLLEFREREYMLKPSLDSLEIDPGVTNSPLTGPLYSNIIRSASRRTEENREKSAGMEKLPTVETSLVGTQEILLVGAPKRVYVHTCIVCPEGPRQWIGTEPNPDKCTYCGSRRWRDAKTEWERKRPAHPVLELKQPKRRGRPRKHRPPHNGARDGDSPDS